MDRVIIITSKILADMWLVMSVKRVILLLGPYAEVMRLVSRNLSFLTTNPS